SDYRAARLFQTATFHLEEGSTLSLDLLESWIDYVTAHRQEQDYRFLTRYHRALTHRLGVDVDAGIDLRRGQGVDQLLATFRPTLKYIMGKMTVDAGYSYEYQLFLNNEEHNKQMFFLRLRRHF